MDNKLYAQTTINLPNNSGCDLFFNFEPDNNRKYYQIIPSEHLLNNNILILNNFVKSDKILKIRIFNLNPMLDSVSPLNYMTNLMRNKNSFKINEGDFICEIY